MAYYYDSSINSGGVWNYGAILESDLAIPSNTPFDIYFAIQGLPSNVAANQEFIRLFGNEGNFNSRVLIFPEQNGNIRLTVGSTNLDWTTSAIGFNSFDYHYYRFVRDESNNIELFVDGQSLGTKNNSGSITFNRLLYQNSTTTSKSHIKLYALQFSWGGQLKHSYNTTLSAETGDTLLIDEVGGNHATFTFAQTDRFVYYYDFLNEELDESINDNCLKLTSASESISLPLSGAYDVDAHLTDGTTINYTGSGTLVINGSTPKQVKKVVGNDSNNQVFYDCNRSPAAAPVVPELINGQDGAIIGGATYEPIIDTVTFTTGDYPDLPTFVTAESANSDYREYLAGTTAGATISGFSDGVIINGGTVTSPITLTQTGIAVFKNATLDDVDATGAAGDVAISDCEVNDVTS